MTISRLKAAALLAALRVLLDRMKVAALRYPQPLDSYFKTGRCPDCGCREFATWQDGGHDLCISCLDCSAEFGLQLPPFNLIERIGRGRAR
jgi:hypothetical protein